MQPGWKDQIFWKIFSKLYDKWKDVLIVVKPETVIKWRKKKLKEFWAMISKKRFIGRPNTDYFLIKLIRKMVKENPLWGATKIHGALLKLGLIISERTVSRYIPKRDPDPKKRISWKNFLETHLDSIIAVDFFTIFSWGFKKPFQIFFMIDHSRRKILHFATTKNPNKDWVLEQFKIGLGENHGYKYCIMDNDSRFRCLKNALPETCNVQPVYTSFRSPWQNGVAERWVKTVKNEFLDLFIPLNQYHLTVRTNEFVDYYNNHRTHLFLNKDSPVSRAVQRKPGDDYKIVSIPVVHGLHHRYEWRKAA